MDYIKCSQCSINCPNTKGINKRYFTTTQYGGILCSIQCCLSWILYSKINKSKCLPINESIYGTFKIVCSKIRSKT